MKRINRNAFILMKFVIVLGVFLFCASSQSHAISFTDMGDGTIMDNDSGLIWLKDASSPDLAGTDPSGMADWATATAAAAALSDGTGGLTDGSAPGDWRLPTILEWESFINALYEYPALGNAAGDAKWSEADAFTGVQSTVYWSSTEYTIDQAWVADMSIGWMRYAYKDPGPPGFYVWPVRVSPVPEPTTILLLGSGLIGLLGFRRKFKK